MTSQFQTLLDPLTRLVGVQGAMLVSGSDGLVIAEALMETVRGDALAALSASLVGRVRQLAGTAGRGEPLFVQLQAKGGAVFVATAPADLLVVVLGGSETPVGLARVEMRRAVEHLA